MLTDKVDVNVKNPHLHFSILEKNLILSKQNVRVEI